MLRYGSGRSVSTTTTEDSLDPSSERRIRRLRLTLHAGDNGHKEQKTTNSAEKEKDVNGSWKKKNGLIQRERPAGRESPQQHLRDMTNGAPETAQENPGPKVYGVVQRTGSDRQQEVMAREWTVSHLQDEMKYIREVRDSLEKVRERMYGQFGGMQQSMQKLSQEIKAANSHQRSLESEVRIRTTAMESFDQMNSSLISTNIGLQKSLLENCQKRLDTRDEVRNLQSTCEKTQEKLRNKEKELEATQIENQTLRLQVESAREANNQALLELSAKLQQEYEEKLREEQRKHREEVENLQAQLDEYIRRLEEAESNLRIAEAKIAERDQRIIEVERLLDCMGKEKSQLDKKLQECEHRLRLMELTDTTDASAVKRSKELKSESVDLRERIKHLNDMVFCQQRKVKGMIEEVQSLRAQVAQKDMFISELLDRIAIVECENNELEDKLKYFMSTQNRPQEVLEIREIGVGCDLLPRHEAKRRDVELPVLYEPAHIHPMQQPPPVQQPSPVKPPLPTPPSSTTPPRSPTLPLSPTQPLSPMQPSSPTQLLSPTLPESPTLPVSPTLSESPTRSVSPTLPVSPTLSVSSTLPSSLIPPLSSSQPSSPTTPFQNPFHYLSTPTQPRTFTLNNPPPSRLDSSLLRYTPVQYSRFLQNNPSVSTARFPHTRPSESEPPVGPVQSGRDEVDAKTNTDTQSSPEESSSLLSSRPRSRAPQVDSPFMKLLEITKKINIDETAGCRVLFKTSNFYKTQLTGRQGQVGVLRNQSKEELQELVLRQEKILSNKRFLQSLPDKGKKIEEFTEKLRLAIEHHDEEERRQSLVFVGRTELQSKYQQAFNLRQHANQNRQSDTATGDGVQEKETSPVCAHMLENTVDKQHGQFVSSAADGETTEMAAAGDSVTDETKEFDLVGALCRIKLSETSSSFSNTFKDPLNSTPKDNYLPKKPHYVTVLERTEKNSALRKQQSKLNELPHRSDISPSGSSSPRQSSVGSSTLSTDIRRERDRKHLDDITAARLPPLHYSPAQLLSLDESVVLLKEQAKKQQELQAKLAAQKLSEGFKISMGSYTPESGLMAAYREVHDEEAQLSSDSEED
ncbi:protein GRINL1A [Clinocottus analis]|uniref:protein GRINL1A n=1 Tax=Clinocottus analis TaxID=304258 RepID=UPI0035BF4A7F